MDVSFKARSNNPKDVLYDLRCIEYIRNCSLIPFIVEIRSPLSMDGFLRNGGSKAYFKIADLWNSTFSWGHDGKL